MEPQAGHEVWLAATLQAKSAWVPRAVDLTDFTRGEGSNVLAVKTLSLESGSKYAILFNSPGVAVERKRLIE